MSAQQLASRVVVFTEDGAVDVVEAVAGNQPVPARGTGETLEGEAPSAAGHLYLQHRRAEAETHFEVVNASLSSHHHLTGRNGLSTCTAGSGVSKQPAKAGIQALKASLKHSIDEELEGAALLT